jgi:cytochrome c biogenesis protein CcmG/thiol:disulfide interchange protein DsbE
VKRPTMRARHVAFAAVAVLACLATGCSRDAEPAYTRVRVAAPTIDGAPERPALLVVFWASWCKPCVEETDDLLALVADLPERLGVVVLSHDDDLGAAEAHFGRVTEPAFLLRLDAGKSAAAAFGVDRLPAAFVTVDGGLVARFDGPGRWSSAGMRRLLGRLTAPNGESDH